MRDKLASKSVEYFFDPKCSILWNMGDDEIKNIAGRIASLHTKLKMAKACNQPDRLRGEWRLIFSNVH